MTDKTDKQPSADRALLDVVEDLIKRRDTMSEARCAREVVLATVAWAQVERSRVGQRDDD